MKSSTPTVYGDFISIKPICLLFRITIVWMGIRGMEEQQNDCIQAHWQYSVGWQTKHQQKQAVLLYL